MRRARSYSSLILMLTIFLSLVTAPFAFQSDELLLDDEEFGLEGGKSPNPQATSRPVSTPPSTRRRSADTGSDQDSKVQFPFEHAFGDTDFSPAGTFSARLKASSQGGQMLTKLRFSRDSFGQAEKDNFKRILEDDDFYRIRLPSNVLNHPGREYTISSVKARCLTRDALDELFVLHMEGVNILAVSYGPTGACQYPRQLKLPTKWSFKSHTFLKYGDLAPRTPVFSEVIPSENGEGEEAKLPEKTFLAKYWMYLIPLGLIVMNAMTQAMNMPEDQGTGTGQPGSQAQQAVAGRGQAAAVRRR